MGVTVLVDGEPLAVTIAHDAGGLVARVGDVEYRGTIHRDGETWRIELGERVLLATVIRAAGEVWIAVDGEIYRCGLAAEERATAGATRVATPRVTAPMPGKVLDVVVTPGQRVAAGDPLVVLEAMKMETVVSADTAGIVTRVHVRAGAMVEPGQLLVELEPS